MDATMWIKVIGFTALAFGMWIIGYVAGRYDRK